MIRKPFIEERYWWPDALERFGDLAASGTSRSAVAKEVAPHFGVSESTIRETMDRGSVLSYPSKSPERAKAWAAGKPRFGGKPCKRHGTTTRYTNDGRCVACIAEDSLTHRYRKRSQHTDSAR